LRWLAGWVGREAIFRAGRYGKGVTGRGGHWGLRVVSNGLSEKQLGPISGTCNFFIRHSIFFPNKFLFHPRFFSKTQAVEGPHFLSLGQLFPLVKLRGPSSNFKGRDSLRRGPLWPDWSTNGGGGWGGGGGGGGGGLSKWFSHAKGILPAFLSCSRHCPREISPKGLGFGGCPPGIRT